MSAPTVEVRRAADRFVSTEPGVVSRHCFSYGMHYDPANVAHAALLVCNEDLVQVGRGYDDHPHANAEIVTWVLSGTLRHTDSYGSSGLVYPGLVQRMSAGNGIVHAERNDGYRIDADRPYEPVHFVQMWVRPDEAGGAPSYQHGPVAPQDLSMDWVPAVSGHQRDAIVTIGSRGSTLWLTVLAPGATRHLPETPNLHLFVARGQVEVEGAGALESGDTLRLRGRAALGVTGVVEAELLVWAMAAG